MENPSSRKENNERKYLKFLQKNQSFKVKNSLLELKKGFIELKVIEVKIKTRDRNIVNSRDRYFLNQLLYL